jgi:hypothetical protein
VAALLGLVAVIPAARASQAATSVTPVYLEGEGNADVTAELSSWQNDVAADTSDNVIVDYADGAGDYHARQDFLSGSDNYVISGVPFTDSELAELGGSSAVVAVPLMPTGLAFLVNPPDGGFTVTKTDSQGDTTTAPYGPSEGNTVPYVTGDVLTGCPQTGCPPVNVPATNLAAMIEGDGTDVNGLPLNYWGQPQVLDSWDQSALDYDPAAGDSFSPLANSGEPITYLRQEPDDESYYLQSYFSSQAPSEFNFPASSADDGEALPTTLQGSQPSELGLNAEITAFESDYDPKTSGPPGGGTIAEVPPSGANLVEQSEDALAQEAHANKSTAGSAYAVPEFIQLQNDNGDWVPPTPGAIEAAVDAGAAAGENACSATDNNAMYGMNNTVSGAYPITWVDCLYAPASGLTVSQTDALAGMIRYLATTGQTYMEPNGDGQLPAVYVTQALAAANTLVTDNCAAAGGSVVLTTRATPWTTVSAAVTALGAVDQCETALVASTVTTPTTVAPSTSPATSSPVVASPGNTFFGGDVFSSTEETPPTTAAPAATSAPTTIPATAPSQSSTKALVTASIAANLPEPLSTSFDQNLDKLSALVVGGALFLAARRIFRWMTRSGS